MAFCDFCEPEFCESKSTWFWETLEHNSTCCWETLEQELVFWLVYEGSEPSGRYTFVSVSSDVYAEELLVWFVHSFGGRYEPALLFLWVCMMQANSGTLLLLGAVCGALLFSTEIPDTLKLPSRSKLIDCEVLDCDTEVKEFVGPSLGTFFVVLEERSRPFFFSFFSLRFFSQTVSELAREPLCSSGISDCIKRLSWLDSSLEFSWMVCSWTRRV